MTIGIASPTPNGIPGFNFAGMYVNAGIGGGAINATPLPGWYNVIRFVFNANDSVSLPPATCGGEPIMVKNHTGEPGSGSTANTVMVFANTTPYGIADVLEDTSGNPTTTGVAVAPGQMAMFWAVRPQAGFTNAWHPGRWMVKILT